MNHPSINHQPTRKVAPLLLALLASTMMTGQVASQDQGTITKGTPKPVYTIGDVRLGFFGAMMTGQWIPINIDLKAEFGEFKGFLRIKNNDAEDDQTVMPIMGAFLEKDTSRTMQGLIRLGKENGPVAIELVTMDGTTVARKELRLEDETGSRGMVPHRRRLVVQIGSPTGLKESAGDFGAISSDTTAGDPNCQDVALTTRVSDLPNQWMGYEGVSAIVLATRDSKTLDELDPTKRSAIDSYVRQGGHLVITVAGNWEIVSKDEFFQRLLPVKLTGVDRVKQLDFVESFADSKTRLTSSDGMEVAQLAEVKGRAVLSIKDRPVIVTGMAGLGKVTVVAFDTEVVPFANWGGKNGFWIKLLEFQRRLTEDQMNRPGRWGQPEDAEDLSNTLAVQLEQFSKVAVVPFHIVALMVFGYILLIGPIDYLILKYVFGRLEWTWITFPIWVLLVSLAAYYGAYILKGSDMRINRLEILDVDYESGTSRGTGFMALFSPRTDTFSLKMNPGSISDGTWAQAGGRPDQNTHYSTWFAAPYSGMRGLSNAGSSSIFAARSYQYGDPQAKSVNNVPVQIWSLKTFQHKWLAQSKKILDIKVRIEEGELLGSITNLSDRMLTELTVIYNDQAVTFGKLGPGDNVDLSAVKPRYLAGYISGSENVSTTQPFIQASEFAPDSVVKRLLLGAKSKSSARETPSSYLRGLEMSDRLAIGKAIIVAQVEGPLGELWLSNQPIEANATTVPPISGQQEIKSYLRVFFDPKKVD